MRRATAGSPYKRIGEIEACYINANWQTSGIATIHLIRQNPRGGLAPACFQIDLWCAGLKDAWGAIDMTSGETDDHIERASTGTELVRIEPDAARHLIAGGIRFARQNGFRLPQHFDRGINVMGDVPNPATADLRMFGKDGGLFWVGAIEDLRRRLIGCSVKEFLSRPHVDYLAEVSPFHDAEPDDEDFDDDSEIEEIERQIDEIIDSVVQTVCRLCHEQGEQPSPMIYEAVKSIMVATSIKVLENEDSGISEAASGLKDTIKNRAAPECPEDIKEAINQVFRVMPDGPSCESVPELESK